ncbi:3'-5' exonuclease [Streptacidiphilus jiangxiensis]|uniref:DNA polymerase-3 subunit epsilon n=1 Tax=Streptacidiphilus jiangxiensis TaxID=235985 RepID=A0A1H7WP35_STRJI|nr:3'-5' exonuclease [Streptacidiphilus jiangxiensis]SEM23211.1 DNA polymerase-3 subunit epsilon [Streptacidiphilus jiangxiensis]
MRDPQQPARAQAQATARRRAPAHEEARTPGWVRRLLGRVRRVPRDGRAALRCFDAGSLRRGRRGGVDPRSLVFAAVDLETTGLEPGVDRVCEIGVVLFRADGSVLGEYTTLVDPQRPMAATAIHGIAADQVVDAPTFAQLAPGLERLLAGTVVVAHNLAFEDAFLAAEFRAAGRPVPRWPGLCTLVTARAQLAGPGFGLAALHRSLTATSFTAAHTALGDSRATAELLTALLRQSPAPLRYRGRRPGRPVPGPVPAPHLFRPRTHAPDPSATPNPAPDTPHTWRPRELTPRWGPAPR